MPIVYTYYDPVPTHYGPTEHVTILLWRKSWQQSEFLPIILTHQHAEAHPRYEEFSRLIANFPSTNSMGYDRACWLRWLALAQVGGGLMTDYDTIARAFSPEFLALPDDVTVIDRGGVPCCVHATAEGANKIVNDILTHQHQHDGVHYSDMLFFQAMDYPKALNIVEAYGRDGWDTTPAVHFSHAACAQLHPKLTRINVIKKEMGL